MITRTLLLGLLGAVAVPALSAQTAAPDSAPPSTPPAPTRLARASWTSDRMPLQPGDLITIVVDEQTAASERVSNVATGSRSQRAGLNANISTDAALGPNKGFGTSMRSKNTSGPRTIGTITSTSRRSGSSRVCGLASTLA